MKIDEVFEILIVPLLLSLLPILSLSFLAGRRMRRKVVKE